MTAAISTITSATADRAGARDSLVVRGWLHAEGLAAFVAGLALYLHFGGDPWLFLPILLVPDLGLLGYLAGTRAGAFAYNLVHNWAIGLAVVGLAVATGSSALWIAGAVLVAHVGMDRAVGYGLKYPSGPKPTHLQRV